MKILKHLFPLALFFFFFSGCFSEDLLFEETSCESECIIFQGEVTDPNNDIPVPCRVFIEHYQDSYFFPISSNIGEIGTDDTGFYEFKFEGKRFKSGRGYFILRAEKEGYLSNERDGRCVSFDIDSTKFDIPVNIDILLRPKASLQFLINFKSPSSINNFSYSYKYAATRYRNSIPDEDLDYSMERTHAVAGDQYVHISYSSSYIGQTTVVNDSIFVQAGETGIYEIDI